MIYNTISSKTILSKIYRDLRPSNTSWESDAIEWIGEALQFIGYSGGFRRKEAILTSKDYRVPFPQDFYTLIAVYYEGVKLPFGGNINIAQQYLDESIYIAAKTELLSPVNDFGITRYGSRQYSTSGSDYNYYTIVPNYIQTSFETGDISVVYNAWTVDKDGFPEVPDSPYYREALLWYIIRQMMLGGYEHPNREITYSFADQKWSHYCIAASNDAMFPSPDKVERFNEMWINLTPTLNVDFEKIINEDTH